MIGQRVRLRIGMALLMIGLAFAPSWLSATAGHSGATPMLIAGDPGNSGGGNGG